MKYRANPALFLMLLMLGACSSMSEMAGFSEPRQQASAVQAQPTKVQHFNTVKGLAFSSVVAAFQEMGYEVERAEFNIGLVKAKSGTRTGYVPYVGSVFSEVLVTAHIEQIGVNTTQVRLDMMDNRKIDDSYGASYPDNRPVTDPQAYNGVWARIASAVDLRKQMQMQNGHRAIRMFHPRLIAWLVGVDAAEQSS